MNEQVGYEEYRIILILTYVNLNCSTVLLDYNAMDCKRNCNPLILLDTTIIMCVQISDSV